MTEKEPKESPSKEMARHGDIGGERMLQGGYLILSDGNGHWALGFVHMGATSFHPGVECNKNALDVFVVVSGTRETRIGSTP